MASSKIKIIDKLFLGTDDAVPITDTNADPDAIKLIQDLLRGHGYGGVPGLRHPKYGEFTPNTRKALFTFQKKILGVDPKEKVKLDRDTLFKLVQEPPPNPLASRGYLTLALNQAWTGLLEVVSFVAIFEGAGKFASLNLNTDRAGLSYGIIQWAQWPKRLYDIVNAFKQNDGEVFHTLFGGKEAAEGMLEHVKKGSAVLYDGKTKPAGAPAESKPPKKGTSKDNRYELTDPVWKERFEKASYMPALQIVQVETALAAFKKSLNLIRTFSQGALQSQRALVFTLDLANQHGDGGAEGIFKTIKAPNLSEAQLLERMQNESVRRLKVQFGENSNEAKATFDRRNTIRTTPLLSDEPFQEN